MHVTEVLCLSHSPLMRDADAQGQVFRRGLDRARRAVERFDPSLVVVYAPDHRRALGNVVPPWTIVRSAVGYGDFGTSTDPYDVSSTAVETATTHLLNAGFDVAVADELRLDHGFTQPLELLLGGPGAVPTLPVLVNCLVEPYGRLPRMARLGATIAIALSAFEGRVLVIGSGGLSHSPPNLGPEAALLTGPQRERMIHDHLEQAKAAVNPAWDRRLLDRLDEGDVASLSMMTAEEVAQGGTGAEEIRTWIAAASAGPSSFEVLAYEPVVDWITGMGIVASADLAALA